MNFYKLLKKKKCSFGEYIFFYALFIIFFQSQPWNAMIVWVRTTAGALRGPAPQKNPNVVLQLCFPMKVCLVLFEKKKKRKKLIFYFSVVIITNLILICI